MLAITLTLHIHETTILTPYKVAVYHSLTSLICVNLIKGSRKETKRLVSQVPINVKFSGINEMNPLDKMWVIKQRDVDISVYNIKELVKLGFFVLENVL